MPPSKAIYFFRRFAPARLDLLDSGWDSALLLSAAASVFLSSLLCWHLLLRLLLRSEHEDAGELLRPRLGVPRAAFASFFAMNSSRRVLLSDMTWPRCKSVNASTLMCLMPNFLQKNCRRFQQKWHEDPWCNCRSLAGHFSSAQILQLECFYQHRPNGLLRFITSGIEFSKTLPN